MAADAVCLLGATCVIVLSSFGYNLLEEIEIQDDNPYLGFHEATLLIGRLEMVLSVLRSLLDMDLFFDKHQSSSRSDAYFACGNVSILERDRKRL